MLPPNLVARKSLSRRIGFHRRHLHRARVAVAYVAPLNCLEIAKCTLSARLANLPGSVKARAVRCWGCLLPSLWARSPNSSMSANLPSVPVSCFAESPRGLDASSIANLFASQKDNIAAALPADFGKLLGGTDLLNSLGGAARSAVSAGTQATRAAGAAANVAGNAGQRASAAASTSYNWLYWFIPVVAIAALLAYFLTKPAEQAAQQGATIAKNLMVGGVDVSKQVTDSIASLRSTLGGVTDAASAEAALPKLRDITAQIDQVDDLIGRMTPEQRKLLAGIVSPLIPTLNQLFDKVLAIPAVSDVLKPTIDLIKAKLVMLAA